MLNISFKKKSTDSVVQMLKHIMVARLVPSSVGLVLGSHYAKYATRITLLWLRKSPFVAALVGNLTCPNFGSPKYNRRLISPLLPCLLFVSRNLLLFCQWPVVINLDFK